MKEAIGYTTDDGKFFETCDEAEEHESWMALRVAIKEVVGESEVVPVLAAIAAIPNEIRRYINANEAAARCREIQARISAEDQAIREARDEGVLQQSARLNEPLPDMGSSQQQKAVQFERKINGLGGGGVDASDVCSRKDLAIGAHTESAKARTLYRPSDIRQDAVE